MIIHTDILTQLIYIYYRCNQCGSFICYLCFSISPSNFSSHQHVRQCILSPAQGHVFFNEHQRKDAHRRYRVLKLRRQMLIIESTYKLNESNDNRYCLQLQLLDHSIHYTHVFAKLIYKWTSLQRSKYDDLLHMVSEQNIVNADLMRQYKLRFIRSLIKKITPVLNQVNIQPEEVFTLKIIEIRQDNNNNHHLFPIPLNYDLTSCMTIACLCMAIGYYVGMTRSNRMMMTAVDIEEEEEVSPRRRRVFFYSSLLIKYIVWWAMMFYIFMYKNVLLRYNITLPFFTVILYVCYCLCDHYVFYFLLLLSL